MFSRWEYPSPLGVLTLSECGGALCGLWLPGQKYFAADNPEILSAPTEDSPVFRETVRWLDAYFSHAAPDISTLPLDPASAFAKPPSPFRCAVWKQLCAIPYRETVTYGELAQMISDETGVRTSARAVGNAVGHNPISIIIPCHRVTGAGGALTGYAGGIDAKRFLLELEKSAK